jgi:hypothetical protein
MRKREFWFLSYFDITRSLRIAYMNNTAFSSEQDALDEYARILKEKERLKGDPRSKWDHRIEWALENLKNKKKKLVRML